MIRTPVLLGIVSLYSLFVFSGCNEKQHEALLPELHKDGGTVLTLEVAVGDWIKTLAGEAEKTKVNEAVAAAYRLVAEDTTLHFIDAFSRAYQDSGATTRLVMPFHLTDKARFPAELSNPEVVEELKKEQRILLDQTRESIRARLEKAGVVAIHFLPGPNWHSLRLELPGIGSEKMQVLRKLIHSRIWLEFRELYTIEEILFPLVQTDGSLRFEFYGDHSPESPSAPLLRLEMPSPYPGSGAAVGYCRAEDTGAITRLLHRPSLEGLWPSHLQWCWGTGIENIPGKGPMIPLYASKTDIWRPARVDGSHVQRAKAEVHENTGQYGVRLTLNSEGVDKWAALTRKNVGRNLAITIDGRVHVAPRVLEAVTGGEVYISGSFTRDEAEELAMMLETGALPVRVFILDEVYLPPAGLQTKK